MSKKNEGLSGLNGFKDGITRDKMKVQDYKERTTTLMADIGDHSTYIAPIHNDKNVNSRCYEIKTPNEVIQMSSDSPVGTEDNDYFEMRGEKDTRLLLNEIFLWLSGMGEYPEILAQICPHEIVGDSESDNLEEREKIAERTVVQVLRWVLGEL